MSSLAHVRIHIPGLGEFFIKHWLLERDICKQQMAAEKFSRSDTNRSKMVLKEVQSKLVQLEAVRSLYQQEEQRKRFIQQHRSSNHEHPTTMEKPKPNPGRNQELDI